MWNLQNTGFAVSNLIRAMLQSNSVVPFQSLDDRIRDLCARIVRSNGGEQEKLLRELRAAITEKVQNLRRSAARSLLGGNHEEERPTTKEINS